MTKQRHTQAVRARVPAALAEALAHRADELGRPLSAVLREAVAREVSRPVEPRDRSFVEAWLNGDADGVEQEETQS